MEPIKNQVLSNDEIVMLREKFIVEYAKSKGWNPKQLSTQQLLEITTSKQYKSPGLILG